MKIEKLHNAYGKIGEIFILYLIFSNLKCLRSFNYSNNLEISVFKANEAYWQFHYQNYVLKNPDVFKAVLETKQIV